MKVISLDIQFEESRNPAQFPLKIGAKVLLSYNHVPRIGVLVGLLEVKNRACGIRPFPHHDFINPTKADDT